MENIKVTWATQDSNDDLEYKYIVVCFDDADCCGVQEATVARTLEEVRDTVCTSLDNGYGEQEIMVYKITPIDFSVDYKTEVRFT